MWGVLVDLDGGGIEERVGNGRLKVANGVHLFRSKVAAKRWMLDMIGQAGYERTDEELEEYQYSLGTLEYFHLKRCIECHLDKPAAATKRKARSQ